MPHPPWPLDEEERLAALKHYDVLDTPPEPEFERITRLTARIFDAPIALMTLVDHDRQWFKARIGVEPCQTSRDHGFCSYTILSAEPLIVPDATRDPRFADHALVLGPPHIRFYAGAPLTTMAGQRLGSLCVIDTAPRQISPLQVQALSDLAALAMDALELRLARQRLRTEFLLAESTHHRLADLPLTAEQEKALRANNAGSAFLALMSHELRTPLNAILGFGQLLESQNLDPHNRQSVDHILVAGRRLLQIVDEALDLAQAQTAPPDPAAPGVAH